MGGTLRKTNQLQSAKSISRKSSPLRFSHDPRYFYEAELDALGQY